MREESYKKHKKYMIDTNVFIAAIKKGRSRTSDLIELLLSDPEIEIIVDDILLQEYRKWLDHLVEKNPNIKAYSTRIYGIITAKAHLVNPDNKSLKTVEPFFKGNEADMYHAAACLKSGAILITNDKDFNKLKKSTIVKIISISEAISQFLK